MGAQGTTTVNFGAFPGASDTSVAITGQSGIQSTSLVEAWMFPSNTADHLSDEHLVETITVMAGNIVPGVGFTIYAINNSTLFENSQLPEAGPAPFGGYTGPQSGGRGTRIYGQWNVAWVWN
jgi:hypothetical protein